ncbi:FliH/SctL family protein [Pseudogulbenkiania subflava]|uniref:Flagellar assembly protein FliH n=1 Tax=Pseudogulbenkiania subflava DSM 22618 TaxID=1123014 RepID=A0A1Y6BWP8_9NEIS|nr:flagellar assembly protein FliH [Pseudogulbenkiania subflava]SMF24903.1 flagellar assembly protein FliH [Pseudogulbenkiania subflava DSM 22618]
MKASSSNTIIPGEQVTEWRTWSPASFQDTAAAPSSPAPAADEPAVAVEGESPEPDEDPPLAVSEEGEPADEAPPSSYPTAAELEAIHQEAWQTGHEAGLAEGRLQGQTEALAEVSATFSQHWEPLQSLADQFAEGLNRVEAELAHDILSFSVGLAERLVAAHLACDPCAIESLLRQAMSDLPASLGQARLRVNPADLEVARTFLQQETPETVWQWLADPSIARGGCIIDTAQLRLDLTLAARLDALKSALGLELSANDSPAA